MKKYNVGNVSIKIDVSSQLSEAILKLYPVGSLYLSYESTSPAELFGGEWTQITGRFLRAANDTGTGGADNVTLTVAQLASHNHSITGPRPKGTSFGEAGGGSSMRTTTKNTGSNSAHSNMPAYQDIYCWERTA